MIDIADYEARRMNGGDEAGDVGGDVDEKAKVSARKMPQARARTVKLVNAAGIGNAGHNEADDGTRRTLKALGWQGGDGEQLGCTAPDQRTKLADRNPSRRVSIDFCQQLRSSNDRVHDPFAAGTDLGPQPVAVPAQQARQGLVAGEACWRISPAQRRERHDRASQALRTGSICHHRCAD